MSEGTDPPWIVEEKSTRYSDLKEYSVIAPQGWRDANGTARRCLVAQLDNGDDARLIAAAPELLAFAKDAISWAGTPPSLRGSGHANYLEKLLIDGAAAIAKAEGRS